MSSRPDTVANVSTQPRQLIIGCDGTNNTLTGGSHDTNVLKLIGQLVPAGAGQILYYDPGVGSPDQVPPLGFINELTRKRERLTGLAVGKGIYENIAQAYEFLIDNFQPEDQIYIFGFSRGAFTARCIAGMVNLFGILRAESKPLILTLIRVYFSTPSEDEVPGAKRWARMIADRAEKHKEANERVAQATNIRSPNPGARNVLAYLSKKKLRRSTRSEVADQVREKFTSPHGSTAVVHFTGVWDTVSSVGAPMFQRRITSSGTTSDKKYLRHIRQALSLDEHRRSFRPRLYWEDDYPDTDDFDPLTSRSLRQRWFRGVHSDVGGGYDVNEAGLSDEAYRWMLREAVRCGLRTRLQPQRSGPARKPCIAHDTSHDTPWWGIAGLVVRTNVAYTGKDGARHRVQVKLEGAAAGRNSRVYSVWSAGIKHFGWRFWFALAAMIVFWAMSSWFGYAALHPRDATGILTKISHGAIQFDNWQRTYVCKPLTSYLDITTCVHSPPRSSAHALGAILADFPLIAAYGWLLGLYASWAFAAMAGHRRPDDKVSPLFRLGLAPMFAVVADLVEDVLTILTLWLIWRGWSTASLFPGVLMMLANLAKWGGLLASLALMGCGLYPRISKGIRIQGAKGPRPNAPTRLQR